MLVQLKVSSRNMVGLVLVLFVLPTALSLCNLFLPHNARFNNLQSRENNNRQTQIQHLCLCRRLTILRARSINQKLKHKKGKLEYC